MKKFAAHVHASEVLENAGANEFVGHQTHSVAPEDWAYESAGHP